MSSGKTHHTTEAFATALWFPHIALPVIAGVSCVVPSHSQKLQLISLAFSQQFLTEDLLYNKFKTMLWVNEFSVLLITQE